MAVTCSLTLEGLQQAGIEPAAAVADTTFAEDMAIVRALLVPPSTIQNPWPQIEEVLVAAMVKGNAEPVDMEIALQGVTNKQQRRIMKYLGVSLPAEGCGAWQDLVRDSDPCAPSVIAQQRLTMTPYCKTWSLSVKLRGHTTWQAVRCVRIEDCWHGEYYWVLVTNTEAPPLFVNGSDVLVTGGTIRHKSRLSISRTMETYVAPIGVIRLNPITVSGQFSVPGAKVPRAAFRR